MALYSRRDESVQDHQGHPVSGVKIWLCAQPANSNLTPPSPLVTIYADSAGVTALAQPLEPDAYGHVAYYAPAGVFTAVYGGPQLASQIALTDQVIQPSITAPDFAADSSANGTNPPAT